MTEPDSTATAAPGKPAKPNMTDPDFLLLPHAFNTGGRTHFLRTALSTG